MRMRFLVGSSILVTWFATASTVAYADPEVQALAIATGLIVITAVATPTPTQDESDHVAIEAGRFDAIKNGQPATTFGLEYRIGRLLWWRLRPFAGAGFTTQHSFYGYGGIRLAMYWGEHIVATPSFAVGGYGGGTGKDLGRSYDRKWPEPGHPAPSCVSRNVTPGGTSRLLRNSPRRYVFRTRCDESTEARADRS